MRFAAILFAILTLVVSTSDAFARGRGSGHGRPHRHPHAVFFSGFYFGPPYFYGPPYYYGPAYAATPEPPSVYVEKFEGTPSAQTSGEFFCPATAAYYPEVQECGNGWQRIFRAPPSG
jgi:hypothetical protein